ncbi:unnamed protein product [Trichogramma brassicae]|uniref:CCHC-type domain-containing protein n=1 Tax=Trichogramma brassicae TaxID=86971 RepID=A0A6H5HY55_9HYME|nr:unnamed protein product [Trichogramma brassicae]
MRADLERIIAEVARRTVAEERSRCSTQHDGIEAPCEPPPPPLPPVSAPQRHGEKKKKAKKKAKKAKKQASAVASVQVQPSTSSGTGHPPTSQREKGEWVKVAKKGKKKVPRTVQGRPEVVRQAPHKPSGRQALQPKLRTPSSAAVMLQLLPEAQKRGVTYREILSDAKQKIEMSELGIGGISIRVAKTGARLLEIPGLGRGAKADALAKKLGDIMDPTTVKVSRPVKCAELRIFGLDDSATREELQAAVASCGGCAADAVRVGEIRQGRAGKGTAWVRCPVAAAKKVAAGPLLVGWVSAKVAVLPSKPLRCFRCLETGHVREECTAEVDRSGLCYRCGSAGHQARECNSAPRCVVCAAANRPADHRAGSVACVAARPQRGRGRRPRAVRAQTQTVQPGAAEQGGDSGH